MIRTPLYQIAEKIIEVDTNIPFRLVRERFDRDLNAYVKEDRRYFEQIYAVDSKYPKASRQMTLLCARQTGKSTTSCILGALLMFLYPGYKMLYVAPSGNQANVMSNSRFKKICEESKFIKENFLSSKATWQVRHRTFITGSEAYFRSCFATADRTRGITAWGLNIDEVQDILQKNIPIILHTQSHAPSDLKWTLFTGTPKTKLNIATSLYNQTCQFEWHVQCKHCGHWNYLDEKVIGRFHYVCTACDKRIYPQRYDHGQWFPMNPSKMDTRWGFRIPQIISPATPFEEVKATYESTITGYSAFLNECLGLPSEEGATLISEGDLLKCCGTFKMMTPSQIKKVHGNIELYMGIDHGSGETSGGDGDGDLTLKAFTVITIGGWVQRRFKVFYMEKLIGYKAKLSTQPEYFNKIARLYGVVACGSDWGFGATQNAMLVDKYRWRSKPDGYGDGPVLLEFQSITNRARIEIMWAPKSSHYRGRYLVNRNWLIEKVVIGIKMQRFLFPHERIMFHTPVKESTYASDFLGIYTEYDHEKGTKNYRHSCPDDAAMSVGYSYMTGLQYNGELTASNLPSLSGSVEKEYKDDEYTKEMRALQEDLFFMDDPDGF